MYTCLRGINCAFMFGERIGVGNAPTFTRCVRLRHKHVCSLCVCMCLFECRTSRLMRRHVPRFDVSFEIHRCGVDWRICSPSVCVCPLDSIAGHKQREIYSRITPLSDVAEYAAILLDIVMK